jgi:small subunit ribosomal protein S1
MNSQDEEKLDHKEIEAISEGWWASLMAEDECQILAEERKRQPTPQSDLLSEEAPHSEEDQNWDLISDLYNREVVITGTVVDFNKGGLLVCSDEFSGFVPVSHLDEVLCLEDEEDKLARLEGYLGCRLMLKVIECDPYRGRVVLSERAAQAEPGRRQKLLDSLVPNQVVRGRVTNITDFGVFVDLGGVEGLIHISELSWGRVLHPRNHAEISQNLEVMVLQVNRNQCRVSLSLKRLAPNPWKEIESRYPKGVTVDGVITEVVKFGAFARLEDGLEGLIHVSEMGAAAKHSPSEVFTPGQHVFVEVVLVDSDRQRMSLRLVE